MYVQRLVHAVLGIELSEERGTIRRYIVTHEDPSRGLLFHPALLEKLHKSNGAYGFGDYAAELHAAAGARRFEHVVGGVAMRHYSALVSHFDLAAKVRTGL